MSNGLFHSLPGSNEMAGLHALPTEPWLLPISDRAAEAAGKTAEELQAAVRRAARPFWMAANGLCIALGLALVMQCATGWMPTTTPRSAVTVAQATPPTIAPQTASLQR